MTHSTRLVCVTLEIMKAHAAWTVAVIGGCLGLGFLAIATDASAGTAQIPSPPRLILTLALLASIILFYLVYGRQLIEETNNTHIGPWLLVPVAGLLAFLNPNMMSAQIFLHPLWWSTVRGRVAGVALTSSGVIAIVIGGILGGNYPGGAPSLIVGAAVWLTFSIVMGLWIARIHEIGAENARLVAQLRSREAEIAALNRDVGAVHERGRLSRDLHDTVAQTLTGVVMLSRRALRQADSGSEALRDTVSLIEFSAAEALAETRAMVAISSSIEGSTLIETLARFCERFGRETGIIMSLETRGDGIAGLSRSEEVILLRCVQEGLANVRKHAHAHAARVELVADTERAVLTIEDDGDGPGSSGAAEGGHFGLAGLSERVAHARGTVALTTARSGGGRLRIVLPLNSEHLDVAVLPPRERDAS